MSSSQRKLNKFNDLIECMGLESDFNYFIDRFSPSIKKSNNIRKRFNELLRITATMFKWDTKDDAERIPSDIIEQRIQLKNQIVAEHEGHLYLLDGSLGGIPDYNYLPTEYIVANPYLHLNKHFKVNKDCILLYNDPLSQYALGMGGLGDLLIKYANLITEAELTLYINIIKSRATSIASAESDDIRESYEIYQEDLFNGLDSIVTDDTLVDNTGLRIQPLSVSSHNSLTDTIEVLQYLEATFFNKIGLSANYNMKREAINGNEADLNDDILRPLVEIMLETRKKQCEAVNKMFNRDWTVELSESWQKRKAEYEASNEEPEEFEEVEDNGTDEV